jgi:hypothetical protein
LCLQPYLSYAYAIKECTRRLPEHVRRKSQTEIIQLQAQGQFQFSSPHASGKNLIFDINSFMHPFLYLFIVLVLFLSLAVVIMFAQSRYISTLLKDNAGLYERICQLRQDEVSTGIDEQRGWQEVEPAAFAQALLHKGAAVLN